MFLIIHKVNTGILDKVEILGIKKDYNNAENFFYEKIRKDLKTNKNYISICRSDNVDKQSELLGNGRVRKSYYLYNTRISDYPEDCWYLKDKYELVFIDHNEE